MSKPWTCETFPTNQAVWVREKNFPAGASLVTSIAPEGVNIILFDKGKLVGRGITWGELHMSCEQHNGLPCGVKS